MSPARGDRARASLHRAVRPVSVGREVLRTVQSALVDAGIAALESALRGDDANTAIEAARAALLVAQTKKADAEGASKYPNFREG